MSEPLRRVNRTSVVDQVTDQMTQRIISGQWPSGEALPGVRQLAAELGVSVLSVREATRTLIANGMLESRHGSGTFVLAPEPHRDVVPWMLGSDDVGEYEELIEARRAVESEIVRLAIARCTPDQLAQLWNTINDMEQGRTDVSKFLEADYRFHIVLAEAANNRVLQRTMVAIRGPLKRWIANRTLAQFEAEGSLDRAIADHRAIVESVAKRSADEGQAAVDRIMARASEYLEALHDESSNDTSAGQL